MFRDNKWLRIPLPLSAWLNSMKTRLYPGTIISIVFLLLTVIALFVVSLNGYFANSSAENARYLLSALAQTQGAIIAIVFSLTIVAVQVASQSYSLRMTDLLLRSWLFWFLLFVYGVSIIYDVILLNTLTNGNVQNLIWFINTSIYIATIAFWLLFPFTNNTIHNLSPMAAINFLVKEILSDKHNDFSNKEERGLVPLFDLMKKAVKNEDTQTSIDALDQSLRVCLAFINDNVSKSGEERAIEFFCRQYKKIAQLSINYNELDTTGVVCFNFNMIGNNIVQNKLSLPRLNSLVNITSTLQDIGISALDKLQDKTVHDIASSIDEQLSNVIAWKSDVEYLEDDYGAKHKSQDVINSTAGKIFGALCELNLNAMEQDLEFASKTTEVPFKNSFKLLTEPKIRNSNYLKIITSIFPQLIEHIAIPMQIDWLYKTVDILTQVGIITAESGNKGASELQLRLYLVEISTKWAQNQHDPFIGALDPSFHLSEERLTTLLDNIVQNVSKLSNDRGATWLIKCLTSIGIIYGKNGLNKLTMKLIDTLSMLNIQIGSNNGKFTDKLYEETLTAITKIIKSNPHLDKNELVIAVFRLVASTDDILARQKSLEIVKDICNGMDGSSMKDFINSVTYDFNTEEPFDSPEEISRLEKFLKLIMLKTIDIDGRKYEEQ